MLGFRNLRPSRLAPCHANRRREPRFPRRDDVFVFPSPDGVLGSSVRATLLDTSQNGVGLTCLGGIPVNTRFILRLEQPTGGPLMRLFEVVRARDGGGAGTCLIGARFLRDLKPAPPTPPAQAGE
jgi:hypothetical protein